MCLPDSCDQVPSFAYTRVFPLQREAFRNWRVDRNCVRTSFTYGVSFPERPLLVKLLD